MEEVNFILKIALWILNLIAGLMLLPTLWHCSDTVIKFEKDMKEAKKNIKEMFK